MRQQTHTSGVTTLVTLFGRPGAGKTSLGDALAAEYGFVHLPLGRLLSDRAMLREIGIDLGAMQRAVASGRTIDDERLYPWLDRRIVAASAPVVVDGYPRVPSAVLHFNRLVQNLADARVFALHLVCDEATARERVRARARADDVTARLADRNDEYERVQRPLLDGLSPRVSVVAVPASGNVASVLASVVGALQLDAARADAPDAR